MTTTLDDLKAEADRLRELADKTNETAHAMREAARHIHITCYWRDMATELVRERDELRAEVERLHAAIERTQGADDLTTRAAWVLARLDEMTPWERVCWLAVVLANERQEVTSRRDPEAEYSWGVLRAGGTDGSP